jgi:hypothetical protein
MTSSPDPGAAPSAAGTVRTDTPRTTTGSAPDPKAVDPEIRHVPLREGGRRIPRYPCRNCGDGTAANYCPRCGQKKVEVRVSLRRMVADLLEDQFTLSAALPRSLFALLFLPGETTRAYVRGRVARYVGPFRLYLAASVVFFLLLALAGPGGPLELRSGSGPEMRVGGPVPTAAVREGPAGIPVAPTGVEAPLAVDSATEIARIIEAVETSDVPGSPLLLAALRKFDGLPLEEAVGRIRGATLEYIPRTMFVLVPLFAFFLKLLYLRRQRFYVEHFVFSLHAHAFAFLMFTPLLFLRGGLVPTLIMLWMPLYVFLAMKRVYGQRVLRTAVKFALLSTGYLLTAGFAMLSTVVLAIYLL